MAGISVARAIEMQLSTDCEPTVWSDGLFRLSEGTIESLERVASSFDFAIIVLSPRDFLSDKRSSDLSESDNLLLELGIFMGRLGRQRTFLICNESKMSSLPRDLAGISAARYKNRSGVKLISELGPICNQIRLAIKEHGVLERLDTKPCDGEWDVRLSWTPDFAQRIFNFNNKDNFIPINPRSEGSAFIYRSPTGLHKGFSLYTAKNEFTEYSKLAVLLEDFKFDEAGKLLRFDMRTAFRNKLREFDYQPFGHFFITFDESTSCLMKGKVMLYESDSSVSEVGTAKFERSLG